MGYVLFLFVHSAYMGLVAWPYVKMLTATDRHGVKFQFSTLDILAINFGFASSVWLASLGQYLPHNALEIEGMLFLLIYFGTCQATGMLMFLATNAAPSRKSRSTLGSAFAILMGAFVGLFMPVIGVFLIFMNWGEEKRRREKELRRAGIPRPKNSQTAAAKSTAPKSPVSQTVVDPPSHPGSPS